MTVVQWGRRIAVATLVSAALLHVPGRASAQTAVTPPDSLFRAAREAMVKGTILRQFVCLPW
jgi:hypothetical protein